MSILTIKRGLPFLGAALEVGNAFPPYLLKLHAELIDNGDVPIAAIKLMGNYLLHVGEPDAIKQIFHHIDLWARPESLYGKIAGIMGGVLGIAAASGKGYYKQKPHIVASFAGRLMAKYAEVMHTTARQVFLQLISAQDLRQPVDIHALIHQVNAMVLVQCMFNVDTHRPLSDQEMGTITGSANVAYTYAFKAGMTPGWMQIANRAAKQEYEAVVAKVVPLLTKAVDQYYQYIVKNDITESWDIISSLIIDGVLHPDKPENALDIEYVRANVFVLVVAGIDTTLSLEKSLIRNIALYPKLARPVLDELRASDDVIAPQDLSKMPLFSAFVNETLRMSPPASLVPRQAMQDTELLGIPIPAGYIAMPSQAVMHMDARYWNRPQQFKPERFANGEPFHPYAFFPFIEGGHKCTGMNFAWLSAANTMRYLANRYTWSLGDGFREEFGATYQTYFPLFISPR